MTSIIRLRHAKVSLALHLLREGTGATLLLLHGLGESSLIGPPPLAQLWPGPVHGLDLTGHGSSDLAPGGGYTCEALMGDVDAALTHLGVATIHGRGLGAYVGLLIAGARPERVRGVVLSDGPGLAGGGPSPGSPHVIRLDPGETGPPDPFALAELSRDVRPPDYAASFARQVTHFSDLANPIAVSAVARPEWLAAVVAEPGVVTLPLSDALALYASLGEAV
jgi:pimeloyl-ACP methyl ester carboxylesterase